MVAGFALGALLDGSASEESWASSVTPALAARVRACLLSVRGAPDKRAALAALIERVRPNAGDLSVLPELARAQLLPASSQRRKLPLRANYTPDPALLTMLRRLSAKLAPGSIR